jgi:tetratricopeptide (TPR) repeat protein
MTRRLLIQALVLAGILGFLASLPHTVLAGFSVDKPEPDPAIAAAARHEYSEQTAAKYDFHYGRENPFLPSNAQTDNGEFLNPKSFPTAQYCGHCHQATHQQWRESAHSNANRAPWYLKNVALLNNEKGIEFSRHCEGCHDPIALVSGALTKGAPSKRPYDQDGVTCTVCHAIQKVDTRGTGSYTIGVPAVLVDANGAPITRPVSDAEILTHLDRHSAAVMKPFYRTSEYCSACHKAALPQTLNGYKWQRAISLYDEWQNSSFAKESPLPFYKKDVVSTCETCHMQREPLVGKDYGAKNGQLASHRWLGANTIVPQYYNFDEQDARVIKFLQTGVFNLDIFGIEKQDSHLVAPLGLKSFAIAPSENVTVSVVIQNKGIAHSHVPEQRDMYESWVRFTVTDATGKILRESGDLKPSGELDPEAHSFTNRLINIKGELNSRHEVWNNRVVAYNNTIQSGRSQLVRYTFAMPASGAVKVTASVQYRRFDQHFIDFGMGKQHYPQQTVEMISASRTLAVGDNKADAPAPPDPAINPEWMRWNNYGIALLDAQQYAASVAAFEHVASMRPDYADGFTNIAIAMIAWEKYPEARPNLLKSLALAHDNARALYYLALIERNAGNVDLAIEDLQKVAQQFPRSRDAHRELGFSFYQQHKYAEARAEYEAVQSIDPDDLAAHYNLSILYRRLGMKKEASEQAKMFADQKDDPTASVYALEYLRAHTEVASESVVWHAHDLDHKGRAVSTDALPTKFSATQ